MENSDGVRFSFIISETRCVGSLEKKMTVSCAVVGLGYLGKFHAQKYASLENADLVAICDTQEQALEGLAPELGHPDCVTDYRELLGKVDAVSIAVPTLLHYEVAKEFLEAGAHVLLEKPIAATVEQAEELVSISRARGRSLQVGHLERFNPVMTYAKHVVQKPLYIASERLAPFNPRGSDVNVVLDLMIHDIDLILSLVQSPVTKIDAHGAAIVSEETDIANTRLTFENGCVANVTASRISGKTERKMRLFQENSYLSLDFHGKTVSEFFKDLDSKEGASFPGAPGYRKKETGFDASDALMEEIKSFLHAIVSKEEPVVSGEDGLKALQTAMEISRQIRSI